MITLLIALGKRELSALMHNKSDWLAPILFFIIVVSLFPLAMDPGSKLLVLVGPAITWFAVILALVLSLEGLFKQDYKLGVIEQFFLSGYPISLIVLYKVLLHWLFTIVPMFLVLPLLSIMYDLPGNVILLQIITIAIGSLTIQAIGALVSALTLSLPRSGMLVFVIILPILVPVLIFATGAIWQQINGFSPVANLAILGAFALFCISLSPFAVAKVIEWSN